MRANILKLKTMFARLENTRVFPMKGQMTIVGIISILVAVLVLGTLAPVFNTGIGLIQNATEAANPVAADLAGLIWIFLIVALIMSLFGYASFSRERYEG